MTVLDYFAQAFPDHTYDDLEDRDILNEMPLNSICGRDCEGAIDAAKVFYGFINRAHGDYPQGIVMKKAVRDTAADVCICYIRG